MQLRERREMPPNDRFVDVNVDAKKNQSMGPECNKDPLMWWLMSSNSHNMSLKWQQGRSGKATILDKAERRKRKRREHVVSRYRISLNETNLEIIRHETLFINYKEQKGPSLQMQPRYTCNHYLVIPQPSLQRRSWYPSAYNIWKAKSLTKFRLFLL